jgi:hypothetical protein
MQIYLSKHVYLVGVEVQHGVLAGNLREKRPLGRPRHR